MLMSWMAIFETSLFNSIFDIDIVVLFDCCLSNYIISPRLLTLLGVVLSLQLTKVSYII